MSSERHGTPRTIHLAAHFPGVNNTTVWSDPEAGSHIDFSSFVTLAQTAERAKFDFFFLAEGLRLREHRGLIHDLDVMGRPDTFTILAALAAVTDRIGLSGTINSTFNEPYEVARQFATLDHLSRGRAAWNVVTSWDAFTGENFRRGGFLARDDRYDRAREFLEAARELWDSWTDEALVADGIGGHFVRDPSEGEFEHRGTHFDIAGRFNVPRSPQGHPVIFQAGDSDTGRAFAAADADCIFTRHGSLQSGQRFYADLKGRLPAFGRVAGRPEDLARRHVRARADRVRRGGAGCRHQTTAGQWADSAGLFGAGLEQRSLGCRSGRSSSCLRPRPERPGHLAGRVPITDDRIKTAQEWRERAEAKNLSIRELMIEVASPASFIGTPLQVANQIVERVDANAADGFILVPHVTPGGLTEFAETVVPILQEWGRFRTEYEGSTLRDHLGLGPPRTARRAQAESMVLR